MAPWVLVVVAAVTACSGAPPERTDTMDSLDPIAVEETEPPELESGRVPNVPAESCALEPDWTMFQGNARRTGVADAPGVTEPEIAWSTRVGIMSWNNNPIVIGDLVVVGSSGDVWNKPDAADGVYALDRDTGEIRWFHPVENDVNGIAFAGCRIVVGADDGTVRGIDPLTGKEAWSRELGAKVYTQPLPMPGGVFVAAGERGELIDPTNGELVWALPNQPPLRQGAAFDGEALWLAGTDGQVWRVDATGKRTWFGETPPKRGVWGAPTVIDVGVVFGFIRDTTYPTPALTGLTFDGKPLWDKLDRGTRPQWANVRTSPAYVDGKLWHAEAYSNSVAVTDPTTRQVETVVDAGNCMFQQWGSPVANRTQVIVPRHDGGLYLFDRATHRPLWGIHIGDHRNPTVLRDDDLAPEPGRSCSWSPEGGRSLFATPAIARDGTIFAGSGEGWIFAIRQLD